MIAVLMGVSGSGKSTVGKLLAHRLQCDFLEGDDYHSEANIKKMERGESLSDEDRLPWLRALRSLLLELETNGRSAVVTCSALKRHYRRILSDGLLTVRFVYLRGTYEHIHERLRARRSHFMPPELLRSQFDTLEEPEEALVVDVAGPPETAARQILHALAGHKAQ